MKTMKEGFSLVEVIVAIAVLALMALPILAYFTNASTRTSLGRDNQRAVTAAESVAEEVQNCDGFEEIENVLCATSAPGDPDNTWTLEATPDPAGENVAKLSKGITEDGEDFLAKVSVDYDYDHTGVSAEYNDYATPQLKEIYSNKNVVLVETDQVDTAVSYFLMNVDPDVMSAYMTAEGVSDEDQYDETIAKNMTRVFNLNLAEDSVDDDLFYVKGYYTFSLDVDGETYTYEASIEDARIEKAKLENIYMFYNMVTASDTSFDINVDYDSSITTEEASNMHVYFVLQDDPTFDPPSTYGLVCTANYTAGNSYYYSNGVTWKVSPANASDTLSERLVTGKRIAKVVVDVYEADEVSFTEDNRIVHLDTSKGEH